MAKKMLIDATHPEETRVVVVDGTRIEEFDYESVTKVQISGNIYLAKVTRVEPSLQAAFVDYGGNRHGFLAFAEIHPDYYQIPVADREALIAAQKAAEADAESDEDAEEEAEKKRSSAPSGSRRRRSRSRSRSRSDENGQSESKSSEKSSGGRPPRMTLAPLGGAAALPEKLVGEAGAAALQALSSARSGPELPKWEDVPEALRNPPAPEVEAESAEAPDLSDVTEIEIRRAPTDEEAETLGDGPVVERVEISDGEVGERSVSAAPESAGADLRDVLRAAPESAAEADDAGADPEIEGEDDGAEIDARDASQDDDGDADGDDSDDADRSAKADIEEVGADDARDEIRPRTIKIRDYKIQEVIKKRQIMLVQVVKEERGTKGAALTTYISLAGRYCVLMPNTARGGGISRKITNAADRKRLKSVAGELEVPEGMGLIVRTAGANRTKAEIKRDYEYLLRQWSAVRELTLRSIAPTLIYEEGSLIKRAIRDLYNKDIDAVLVEGEDSYREAKDYMKMLMPSHAKNVQPYRDRTPLFIRYQVESQMAAMMNPTVQLKSGGYLVIGVTEALVAVDVNSGRSTKESSIEETALKTNLEAAEEVARQLRLRDLAGLIVIDFIDMEESKNNRAVEKKLKDKLKTDRARIQVGRISGFGLLEMSRQRLRPGLLEATTQPCPHCKGVGVIRSEESMSLAILRAIEEEGVKGKAAALKLTAPISVANYLINMKRVKIAAIEARYGLQVLIEADPSVVSPDFGLERTKQVLRDEPSASEAIQIEAGFADQEIEDAEVLEDDEDEALEREADEVAADESEAEAETERADGEETGDEDRPSRKRRGRRGGRRRRSKSSEGSDPMPVIDLETSGEDDGESDGDEDSDRDADSRGRSGSEDAATAADDAAQEAEVVEASAEAGSDESLAAASEAEAASAADDESAGEDSAGEDSAGEDSAGEVLVEEVETEEVETESASRSSLVEDLRQDLADEAPASISSRSAAAHEEAKAEDGDVAVLSPAETPAQAAPSSSKERARRRTGWWSSARRGA